MKFRDLLDDGELSLVMDLVRANVSSPEMAEEIYYAVLDADTYGVPSVNPAVMESIQQRVQEKTVSAGLVSGLVQLAFALHQKAPLQDRFPPLAPPVQQLAWRHDEGAMSFFLFLLQKPRTRDEALLRWSEAEVDKYWSYFSRPHIQQLGFTARKGVTADGSETLHLVYNFAV